jgi:hypothetical protein
MNQQQKKKICEKINSAKYAKLITVDEFHNESVKVALTELKKEINKNPSCVIVFLS